MKKFLLAGALALSLTACDKPADVASRNISQAADNFEIMRRVTFVNGMTNQSMLVIEGLCSLGNTDTGLRMSVTCKVGRNEYKKHFLGLAATVSFFVEQLDAAPASTYRYRVFFNPAIVIPDITVN